MKGSRGLSGVITTLIIILLVIAAIGIIWAVVSPFLKGGGGKFNAEAECMSVNLEPTALVCTGGVNDVCNVTVHRLSGGGEIAGVKLIFYDADQHNTYINTTVGNIQELATVTFTNINTSLTNVSKVEVAAYFKDTSGKEAVCGVSGAYVL